MLVSGNKRVGLCADIVEAMRSLRLFAHRYPQNTQVISLTTGETLAYVGRKPKPTEGNT